MGPEPKFPAKKQEQIAVNGSIKAFSNLKYKNECCLKMYEYNYELYMKDIVKDFILQIPNR